MQVIHKIWEIIKWIILEGLSFVDKICQAGMGTYISRLSLIRRAGITSSFLLGLLLLTTIAPLYNITGVEDTEAATGTAKNSTLTFNSTRLTASTSLNVNSTNGTFSTSDSSHLAAFTLSTNNYTGYTLTLTGSSTNTALKEDTSNSTLSSISSNTAYANFSANNATGESYNNRWGILPSSYKSNNTITTNNTTIYLPSPSSSSAITLDETTTANGTAKSYTIGLGVRANYDVASGTYNNTNAGNTLTLAYVANPVSYSIAFDKGSAMETPTGMPTTKSGSVSVTSITLPNDVPTRTAYNFAGWCLGTISTNTTTNNDSCTGTVFAQGATFGIDKTTTNETTLHAMWNIKTYSCFIQSRDQNADGSYGPYTTRVNSTIQYGGSCSWSVGATSSHKATSYINNNVTANVSQSLNVDRNTFSCYIGYRLQNANGSYGSIAAGTNSTLRYGQTCAWSRSADATYQAASYSTVITGNVNYGINVDRNTFVVDVNPVINGTAYGSGLSGFTFDVYLDGSLVADDVVDYYNTVRYGQSIRVIANSVSGYNITDNADVSYTVTGGLDIRPTWTDNIGPSLTNWWWGNNVTKDAAYLYIQAYDVSGVQTVQCPTSTASGGYSNWYWFNAVWDSGANAWRCDVTPATFGHYDQTYITHLYMYDTRSNGGYISQTSVAIPADKIYIQDLTLAACQRNVGTNGNATDIGDNITVYDKRDEKDYTVRYINGECWMTQNLRLTGGAGTLVLNSTLSNVSSYNMPAESTSNFTSSSYSTDGHYCSTDKNTGCWYNYYSASAGTISTSSNSTAATSDICPKNWHLPTGPNTTANTDLNKLVGNTTSGWQTPTVGLAAFGVVAGGFYDDTCELTSTRYGYWWSATASSTSNRYHLRYEGGKDAQFTGKITHKRYYGDFIRCVRSS